MQRSSSAFGIALILIACTACDLPIEFKCTATEQCRNGDMNGYCEATGFCSFDDPACSTHHRYDVSAGDNLASVCVDYYVTGRYIQRNVVNDATFAPVVMERAYPTTSLQLSAMLDDGTASSVDYHASDGTFAFMVHSVGQRYRLIATLDGTITEYQHTASHLELVDSVAGRLDRVSVTVPTQIRFRYLQAATGNAVIASTGLWTQTVTASGTNFDFNWQTSLPVGSSSGRGLLDSTKNDRLYFTEMANQTGGYTAIVSVATASFMQADGVMATFNTGLANVTLDKCRHVVVRNADEVTRLTGAFGGAFTNGASWSMRALPAFDKTGTAGALVVAVGSQANANADVVATVHNPFVGTSLVASQSVSATYSTSLMGATAVALAHTSVSDFQFPTSGACATDTATLQPTVGIATTVTVGGIAIDVDEKPAAIDLSKPVTMTWAQGGAGPVHSHEVELFEVSVVAGATTITRRYTIRSVTPSVTIAASMFAPMHSYIFHVVEKLGNPMASAGDFATIAFPLETVSTWSHSFTLP